MPVQTQQCGASEPPSLHAHLPLDAHRSSPLRCALSKLTVCDDCNRQRDAAAAEGGVSRGEEGESRAQHTRRDEMWRVSGGRVSRTRAAAAAGARPTRQVSVGRGSDARQQQHRGARWDSLDACGSPLSPSLSALVSSVAAVLASS